MEARNLVSYLKEFCVKLKINAANFEIETESNGAFRCKLKLQGFEGCAIGRSKQSASHVAAKKVWAQILLHPAVQVILDEKDCLPYIQEGDIFWEVRLFKAKQVKSLRELLILVDNSEAMCSGLDMPQRSIPEVVPSTTEVRMGHRVLDNVPIVQVPPTSFLEKFILPVVLVRGGLEESRLTEVIVSSFGEQEKVSKATCTEVQCLSSALEVLHITEDRESSSVEVAHSLELLEKSNEKSPDPEEEQRNVPEEELPVPVPIPQTPVSRFIEPEAPFARVIKPEAPFARVIKTEAPPARIVQEAPPSRVVVEPLASPANDISDLEDEFERNRIFDTFRKLMKTYEHETKPIPISDRHNYFKNLPEDLKAEGFKVINSNDFKSVKEKAIRLLYALKLPHTISRVPSNNGVPLIKVELDCSYEGIFIDFESDIYIYIIDFMKDMLD